MRLQILFTILMAASSTVFAGTQRLYIGCETSKLAPGGIYQATFNSDNGDLQLVAQVAAAENPSFLVISARGDVLYSVNEHGGGEVVAWKIAGDGTLSRINAQPSGGSAPCHLCLSPHGNVLLVANYTGGSVSSFPLRSDGSIGEAASFFQFTGSGPNERRQKEPHAHGIYCDTSGRWVYVPDLGTDKVHIFQLDEDSGKLTPNEPAAAVFPPGCGPRHLALSAASKFAYVNGEMGLDVFACSRNAQTGALQIEQRADVFPTAPDVAEHADTGEIEVHPSGKTLYVSTRGVSSISTFTIAGNGAVTLLDNVPVPVKKPRHFAITRDGKWMIIPGQTGHQVTVFAIDDATGKLRPTDHTIDLPGPVCVVFAPQIAGK